MILRISASRPKLISSSGNSKGEQCTWKHGTYQTVDKLFILNNTNSIVFTNQLILSTSVVLIQKTKTCILQKNLNLISRFFWCEGVHSCSIISKSKESWLTWIKTWHCPAQQNDHIYQHQLLFVEARIFKLSFSRIKFKNIIALVSNPFEMM